MKYLILIAGFLSLFSCKNGSNSANNTDFNSILTEYNEGILKLDPISATYTGKDTYNHQFANYLTEAYHKEYNQFFHSIKEKLALIEEKNLSESEKMSKDLLLWDCNIRLEEHTFNNYKYLPIDQFWSTNLTMGQFASASGAQPFKTVKDYKNWEKRVEAYVIWLQSAQQMMKEGISKGYVLPKSLIKKVIPQFAEVTEENLPKNLYYAPLLHFPEGFSETEKKDITDSYSTILREKLIPEFKKISDFLSNEYVAAGRASSGISSLPQGKEFYDFSIKKYTTTTLSADEIHNLGLSEVKRILTEMEKVKTEVGFTGNIIEFFDYVRNNQELMPFSQPEQVIANFKAIHEKMKPQLAQLFNVSPKTPFEIRRTEAFREASASAEYNQGSLDGTRPGIFYTPIPDATKYNVYSDEALFLHEAIPGHHYQISLTQENTELPEFRKTLWYSAYGEGWALYTESLGKELGLYTDPYQYFGMLSMEMHRAIRLVVDTGIHVKGWTREQAIKYSSENEAEPLASIESEIERYMANPGQALSYKIGQLKIQELRKKAETELADTFDIKEFHKQVLETGCIPLALLENKINTWIERQK